MAKKTHIKVRLVPESKPDSSFVYYAKKPTKGEKAKNKLKLTKYNPSTILRNILPFKSKILIEIISVLATSNLIVVEGLNGFG